MAHYDCDNCGESFGIAFGLCPSCTPKKYKELESELKSIICDVEKKFDIEFEPVFNLLKSIKKKRLEKATAKTAEKMEKLRKKHCK